MNTDNLNEFARWFIQDYMKLGGVCGFNDETIKPIIERFNQSKTIPKKEYEVLLHLMVDCNGNSSSHQPNELCNDGRCEIFKIKRTIDGKIFTVGDMTDRGRIITFRERHFGMAANVSDGSGKIAVHINSLQKVEDKKPILTTEDICINHIPCLSIMDVIGWLQEEMFPSTQWNKFNYYKLKELIKQKIK